MRQFSNYFNAHIKKEWRGVSGKKSSTTSSSNATPQRAFAIFTGQVSPKALFAMERHEDISALHKQICAERGIAGGPAKAEATRRLWEQEDAAEWEEKANNLATDIQG